VNPLLESLPTVLPCYKIQTVYMRLQFNMKKYEELLAGYATVLYTTSVNLGGKRRKSPTRIVFNRMKRKNG